MSDSLFKGMLGFLAIGDLDKDAPLSKKVKYKERIVFATMRAMIPEWEKPRNWDNLSDEVKMERLKALEEIAKE